MLFSDEVEAQPGSGTLVLHLLGRCNLICQHCYMDGGPHRRERLPLDVVLTTVREASAVGIGQIYLTGGEPTLYSGLDEVLEVATASPQTRVTLCTNATRLSEKLIVRLANSRVAVNVSIDGEPTYHDSFRGAVGAFARAEQGIRSLVATGIKVTLVSTVSQSNIAMLLPLFHRALEWRVDTFRVQPLLKLGRGAEIADSRLTAEQLDQLILDLSDLANRYRDSIRCGLIGQSRRFLQAHPCGAYVCNGAGCHRRVAKELKKIVVREDATILPEASNLDPGFAIGMLGEAPLAVLVERYLERGYDAFDRLCRTTYSEIMPSWPMAVVPWDQLIAERSRRWRYGENGSSAESGHCGAGHACEPMH